MILILNCLPCYCIIKKFVGLGPRRLDSRPPCLIQNAELDHGTVNDFCHFSTQSIDFPNDISLCQAPDGRVAGQLSDCVNVLRNQQCFFSETGGR